MKETLKDKLKDIILYYYREDSLALIIKKGAISINVKNFLTSIISYIIGTSKLVDEEEDLVNTSRWLQSVFKISPESQVWKTVGYYIYTKLTSETNYFVFNFPSLSYQCCGELDDCMWMSYQSEDLKRLQSRFSVGGFNFNGVTYEFDEFLDDLIEEFVKNGMEIFLYGYISEIVDKKFNIEAIYVNRETIVEYNVDQIEQMSFSDMRKINVIFCNKTVERD